MTTSTTPGTSSTACRTDSTVHSDREMPICRPRYESSASGDPPPEQGAGLVTAIVAAPRSEKYTARYAGSIAVMVEAATLPIPPRVMQVTLTVAAGAAVDNVTAASVVNVSAGPEVVTSAVASPTR